MNTQTQATDFHTTKTAWLLKPFLDIFLQMKWINSKEFLKTVNSNVKHLSPIIHDATKFLEPKFHLIFTYLIGNLYHNLPRNNSYSVIWLTADFFAFLGWWVFLVFGFFFFQDFNLRIWKNTLMLFASNPWTKKNTIGSDVVKIHLSNPSTILILLLKVINCLSKILSNNSKNSSALRYSVLLPDQNNDFL